MDKSKIDKMIQDKERALMNATNKYLMSNLRKDRDKCLILKGKIEMLQELKNPKGAYEIIIPKPSKS